jgi:hypothetical protein
VHISLATRQLSAGKSAESLASSPLGQLIGLNSITCELAIGLDADLNSMNLFTSTLTLLCECNCQHFTHNNNNNSRLHWRRNEKADDADGPKMAESFISSNK